MISLLCALCLTQANADAPTKLTYYTPAATPQKTVESVGKQMEKRIKLYGYKGVIAYPAAVDDRALIIAFEPGFSPAMIQAIDRLANIQGQAYIWPLLQMTQKEFEMWIPGKTSPPGTSWYIQGEEKCIMDDQHKMPFNVKYEKTVEFGQEHQSLVFVDGPKIFSAHLTNERNMHYKIMLDGKQWHCPGTIKERQGPNGATLGIYEWSPSSSNDEIVSTMIALGNPLPVQLSRIKKN